MSRYTYGHTHCGPEGDYWYIQDMGTKGYCNLDDPVVFKMPFLEEHWELDVPPEEFRKKFEELEGRPEFIDYDDPPAMPNLVELMADDEDCAWDQPCAFGYRVECHAVYCHNEKWLYAPRKCRCGGEDYPHEDCRGFKPNPLAAALEAEAAKKKGGRK